MPIILPQGPEHLGERREQCAVHSLDELLNLFEFGIFFPGDGLFGQFLKQGGQKFGVKDLRCLGKGAQACFLDAETLLNFFQCGGLLDSPQAGEYGGKEIKKHQGQILIIVKYPVLMTLDIMKAV